MIRHNGLLAALPQEDRDALLARMEGLDLPRGLELSLPRTQADYCYFPSRGIISTVVVSSSGRQAEIGVIGREGMSPASAILGSDQNPYRTVMQVAGQGWRMKRELLCDFLDECAPARRIFLRWAQSFAFQNAYTALSNAVHPVDERLARWILMCHDRVEGDRLELTHEFLAIMLAVRRASVTNALHVLEGLGLIHSLRGTIVVRDRTGLQDFARDSYGGCEREYTRLFQF